MMETRSRSADVNKGQVLIFTHATLTFTGAFNEVFMIVNCFWD